MVATISMWRQPPVAWAIRASKAGDIPGRATTSPARSASSPTSSGCTSSPTGTPSISWASRPKMRATAGLAYRIRPSSPMTHTRSEACSTRAARRISVASTRCWAAWRSVRSRAIIEMASTTPSASRWATSTADTGTAGPSPIRRSSPRHVPPLRTAGRAVVAYWACDQPSNRSSSRGGVAPARPPMWCCMASLAHTTSSPDGSKTATGSGLDSSTRVNSWARRVSSTSSETSATVSSAPLGPPGPVRGTVDRSSHRAVPSSFSRRRRPRRATPSTRAR